MMPYVLPHDPRSRHKPTDDEFAQLVALCRAYRQLIDLGWRESMYAPRDGLTFLAIEVGSTGIHECHQDADGHFWIYDGDVWPAKPILWKPKPTTPAADAKEPRNG